jgi:hypothetical protein
MWFYTLSAPPPPYGSETLTLKEDKSGISCFATKEITMFCKNLKHKEFWENSTNMKKGYVYSQNGQIMTSTYCYQTSPSRNKELRTPIQETF